MKRPASRSGARVSGKSGKSGRSGRSGKSGRSGRSGKSGQSGASGQSGHSGYALQREGAARAQFLVFVITLMRATSKKLHGTEAPLKGSSNSDARAIEACTSFKCHKRCECSALLDSSTLELLDLCMPVEAVVRLIYSILLRTIFCGYGLLSLFLSEYERRVGISFRAAILRKAVDVQVFQQIVRSCKLGTATPEARVNQWGAARRVAGERGPYNMAEVGARYIGEAINEGQALRTSKAISRAATESAVSQTLEHCWVLNPVLKYLIYRDLQLWNLQLPDSFAVGPGAREELERCSKSQWHKTEEEQLEDLHNWIEPQLPKDLVRSVCGERGWTPAETEHCLCEHRKYLAGLKKARPQRIATGVKRRQQERRARLKKVWRLLQFKRRPRCP